MGFDLVVIREYCDGENVFVEILRWLRYLELEWMGVCRSWWFIGLVVVDDEFLLFEKDMKWLCFWIFFIVVGFFVIVMMVLIVFCEYVLGMFIDFKCKMSIGFWFLWWVFFDLWYIFLFMLSVG